MSDLDAIELAVRTPQKSPLPGAPTVGLLIRKSTKGMPGGRFVGEGGFQSQKLDGREMMLGFRQVRAAQERNTLRLVCLCIV